MRANESAGQRADGGTQEDIVFGDQGLAWFRMFDLDDVPVEMKDDPVVVVSCPGISHTVVEARCDDAG